MCNPYMLIDIWQKMTMFIIWTTTKFDEKIKQIYSGRHKFKICLMVNQWKIVMY